MFQGPLIQATAPPVLVPPQGDSREVVLRACEGFSPYGELLVEPLDERFRGLSSREVREALALLQVALPTRHQGGASMRSLPPYQFHGMVLPMSLTPEGTLLAPLCAFLPSLGGGIDWGIPRCWPQDTYAFRVRNDSLLPVSLAWQVSGYKTC